MKTPGALPVVVLPVLASALHLDPVLNQVQGADEALGDLVHLGNPDLLYPDLDPRTGSLLGSLQVKARDYSKDPSARASRFRYLLMNRLKHI